MRAKALHDSPTALESRALSSVSRKPATTRVHKRGRLHVRAGLLPDTDQSESYLHPQCFAYLRSKVWLRLQDMLIPSLLTCKKSMAT